MILCFHRKTTFNGYWGQFGGRFGKAWGTLGPLVALFAAFLQIFFQSDFQVHFRSCWGAGGPAAVVRRRGEGIPFRYPVMGSWRKFHTPSGRLKPVAADLKGYAPCRWPP